MFVLRRYDRNPDLVFLFSTYSEVVRSTKTELNGIEASTIFLENENSKLRAIKLGWKDETHIYNQSLEEELKKHEEEKSAKVTKKSSKSKTKKTKSKE